MIQDSPEWLTERQRQYALRVAEGTVLGDRSTLSGANLHKQIVEDIDMLPVSEGGRK